MSDKPLVSVLLPAYQASEFIGVTLTEWFKQTLDDYELIISVDQGTDDTHDVCLALAADNPRARVIKQERRLGWIRNANFLQAQARGQFGVIAGHDDLVAPRFLERLAARLQKNSAAVISFSDMYWRESSGKGLLNDGEKVWSFPDLEGIKNPLERAYTVSSGKGIFWTVYRGLFRMAAARAVGGLKPHRGGDFAAGWPWIFHLSLLGEFERVPYPLCTKVQRPGSASSNWTRSTEEYIGVYEAFLRELWASSIPVRGKLQLAGLMRDRLQQKN